MGFRRRQLRGRWPFIGRRFGPPARRALRELRRANDLMESGGFAEASQRFVRLAHAARERNILQAPDLLLQASRAQLKLDEVEAAFSYAQRSLSWLAVDMRWHALSRLGARAAAEFEEAGHQAESSMIREFISEKLESLGAPLAPEPSQRADLRLPEKCPYCGGTVDHEHAEVLEEGVAICGYCGSRLGPREG